MWSPGRAILAMVHVSISLEEAVNRIPTTSLRPHSSSLAMSSSAPGSLASATPMGGLFQLDSSSSTEQTPPPPTPGPGPGPYAAAFAAFLHELGCVCPSLLLVFKFLLVSNT